MKISPAGTSAATLVSIASLVLLSPRWGGTAYTASLILILLLAQWRDGSGLGRRMLAWTAPMVLPLLLVHGVLNAQFPVTSWWLDIVPIRGAGLVFGYDLAVRVLLFSVVAAYWLSVDSDALVEALLRLRLPAPLIMLAMQGFVMGRLVRERVDAIYLAQRARGIPVSASLAQRIGSMPALLIPVVVGTFVEGEARIPVLLAHGYGRLTPSTRPARLERQMVALATGILGCLALGLAADRYL